MKNIFRIILLFALTLTVTLALTSCDLSWLPFEIPGITDKDDEPDKTPDDGKADEDEEDENLDGLVLISKNKANFKIVYSSEAGVDNIIKVQEFVKKLRALGVEVDDPVSDMDAADVTECEILIGTGIRNRGNECNIDDKYLGAEGYVIRVVGKKVIIAGGSSETMGKTFDNFVRSYLKITDKTKEIKSIALDETLSVEKLTKYLISSITISGVDLSNFKLVYDIEGLGDYGTESMDSFRDDLFAQTGYWLELGTPDSIPENEHNFIIRYSETLEHDEKNHGFIIREADGNFYIECSYANSMESAFSKYMQENIYDKMGDISFAKDFYDYDTVSVVTYDQFGAVGNGKHDDFPAMLAAHQYANQCGQEVHGVAGRTYYVGESFVEAIIVDTNINLNGATVIIDDTTETAHKYRAIVLYSYTRTHKEKTFNREQIDEVFGTDTKIKEGDTSIPWLVPELETQSFVRIYNSDHKDFVRWGANVNGGSDRHDIFIIEKDGTLSPDTLAVFDFDDVTYMTIWRTDDKPLTIENGIFKTICCRTVAETGFKNVYLGYNRGIGVHRANVTIKNLDHEMLDEPLLKYDSNMDALCKSYGERKESYPYGGFININRAYNTLVLDCKLDGHTTYYEDKTTSSTPVAMGSYDFTFTDSTHIVFRNVEQYAETGIADAKYWGIMGSNGTKNLTYDNVYVNRFDAHAGFWNGKIINSTIGSNINVIGGGTLILDNVTRVGNSNAFIDLRSDYGSTFQGDIYMKDCTFYGYQGYNTGRGQGESVTPRGDAYVISSGFDASNEEYLKWDFGYTCYLPQNIEMDNFVSYAASTYLFRDIGNLAFNNPYGKSYQITKQITMKNMEKMPICQSAGCTELQSIPLIYIPVEEKTEK